MWNSSMKILIVTPAPPGSRKGNRISAVKWQRMLRKLGHRVTLTQTYRDEQPDVLIALHARRGARSIRRFADEYPDRPLMLALTGTDLYDDIRRSSTAARSLELANFLIVFHEHARSDLPTRLQSKAHVVYQSATAPKSIPAPLKRVFEVTVMGHLRSVKDPFRAALAARSLPTASCIQIAHYGSPLSPAFAKRAEAEMQRNPRYRWFGDVPHATAKQRLARSRLLVISSRIEGSANVLSEALVSAVPVLATRIPGNIGLLGHDYPGYFDVGDTRTLTSLLTRCEQDSGFYETLKRSCHGRRRLVSEANEVQGWKQLLARIVERV
jgi:putative glycosyltransferase (TIGR04348 family)